MYVYSTVLTLPFLFHCIISYCIISHYLHCLFSHTVQILSTLLFFFCLFLRHHTITQPHNHTITIRIGPLEWIC
ncbi:hypothetical protein B484DRAFT_75106 [Ochromonadaceae sp. CCMP2298]|nr:hypothetical protein B484DRAFT_75106 [Ochromonadaceae sp. CCMP2298]